METFLPWTAPVVAALTVVYFSRGSASEAARPREDAPTPFWNDIVSMRLAWAFVAAAALLALLGGFIWQQSLPGLREASYGFAIGAVLALATVASERWFGGRRDLYGVPVSLAVAALGLSLLIQTDAQVPLWLGVTLGAVVAAGLLSAWTRPAVTWAWQSALFAAALSGAAIIGVHRDVPRAESTPVLIGLVAVFAIVFADALSGFLRRQRGGRELPAFWTGLTAAVLILAGAKLVADRFLFQGDLTLIAIGSIATAAAVVWLLPEKREADAGPFAVATLLWVSWSTVAFGIMQGYGIAVATVIALAFLLLLGARKAIVSLGILVPLVFYRVFLGEYPAEARAIDIGQHYSIMGLVVGAAMPVALADWASKVRFRFGGAAGLAIFAIAGVVVLAAVLGINFVIASRGAVGFLVGLGVGVFALGLARRYSLSLVALAGGLGAAMTLGFGYLFPYIAIERETKVRILAWAILAIIILVIGAEILYRRSRQEQSNETVS